MKTKTEEELIAELTELKHQLLEANETIEAIRTGQVDTLVVESENGHQLYTLKSADIVYRVFIENMTEGALTLSKEGIILYCNSQFARMVNMPLSNVISLPFYQFVAPENRVQFNELFNRSWINDCKGEVLLGYKDQQTPVQLSLTTLELEDGVSLSIIISDLTAQKATQLQLKINNEQLELTNKALESSNHDLQQFASVASHDLQEPLRKILVFSDLLKASKDFEIVAESKKYLNKIIDSATRMKNLIIDVLSYSKLSASNNVFECVDLNEIIKETQEDFELVIGEKKAAIVFKDLPCIDVNRGQIRQAFQNIISNALKFSKQNRAPVISINAKRISEKSFSANEKEDGPFCLISIKDNGIGFDEKYLANIFALFERLHSKDTYEGTGIGLAITKKIVEKHNGLISAKSCVGDGAEFLILLPMVQQQTEKYA